MKRMMVSLRPEQEARIKFLKKNKFYDKPYSEVIRFLIQHGLDFTEKNGFENSI
jgi:hypothetical protein